MSPTIVLITGANRGIGKGLLQRYLTKKNHVVIAANRDPDHETSTGLQNLPTAQGTKLIIVKIDCAVKEDPESAVRILEAQGIDHVDIMIPNAGIARLWCKVSEVTAEQMQEHSVVNTYGFIWLYQAFLPLLKKAERPIMATIGSSAAFLMVSNI